MQNSVHSTHCKHGIITIEIGKKASKNYKVYLNTLVNTHFKNKGYMIIKDADTPDKIKWIIGTEESIGNIINRELNI